VTDDAEWCSVENLRKAWRYARRDQRQGFTFDIINHDDIKNNLDSILRAIRAQIIANEYYPAPILRVEVPKNDYSTRPGTTIPAVDLIVLYALAQQLAPLLDPCLCDSVCAYRLNPRREGKDQPLFSQKEQAIQAEADGDQQDGDNPVDRRTAGFPYDWFLGWLFFQEASQEASIRHKYAAVTDITGFFENISLSRLQQIIATYVGQDRREIVDRLFNLLRVWAWDAKHYSSADRGLPQGNAVSSFLSNVYLIGLDDAMLSAVNEESSNYKRYVDDIRLFTSNYHEGCQALVEAGQALRGLDLNIQSAKTKIVEASALFKDDVEAWLRAMAYEEENKVDRAVEFYEETVARPGFEEQLDKWDRVYRRCLTVLREADDARAVSVSLDIFLKNPAHKLVRSNFTYLRNFVTVSTYGEEILGRLVDTAYTFPWHAAQMLRLAAYSRDECADLKRFCLQEATESSEHWFKRVAALFCLGTFALTKQEMAQISQKLLAEGSVQVRRSAYVVLLQHTRDQLDFVLDRLSFFNAPHQECLYRYLRSLLSDTDAGKSCLKQIRGAAALAPTFVHNLYKLDLLKENEDSDHRNMFREVINGKLQECEDRPWPRLTKRLTQINDSFVTHGVP